MLQDLLAAVLTVCKKMESVPTVRVQRVKLLCKHVQVKNFSNKCHTDTILYYYYTVLYIYQLRCFQIAFICWKSSVIWCMALNHWERSVCSTLGTDVK